MKHAAELMRPETFEMGAKVFSTRYGWRIKHPRATHPLKLIHQLLSNYTGLPKGMLKPRHELLARIAAACETYVTSKGPAKFNSDKVMVVRALMSQARARLTAEQRQAAILAFKVNETTEHASVHGGLKLERAANPRGVNVVGGFEMEKLLNSELAKNRISVADMAKAEDGTIAENDPNNLYAIRKFLKTVSAQELTRAGFKVLEYADDVARKDYALRITADKLLWAEMDTPVDTINCTLGDPPGTGLFAADTDGDFFCRVYDQNDENRGWFAHSSFLAGANAMCAGTLKIRMGRLIEIQNNSGHYRPKLVHLQHACQALLDHGYLPRRNGYALFDDSFEAAYEPSRTRRDCSQLYRIPLKLFAEEGPGVAKVDDFEVLRLKGAEKVHKYVNTKASRTRGAMPTPV